MSEGLNSNFLFVQLRMIQSSVRVAILGALLAYALAVASVVQASEPASRGVAAITESTNSISDNFPWGRMAMIGASVTAGFTFSEPLGGSNTVQFRLSRYIDASVIAPHSAVENFGNALFFLRPEPLGRAQVRQALDANPTAVIGIDFLFWFCYGDKMDDAARMQRFESGLKMLEEIRCPLVLGNIPDASAAANVILSPEQIPSAAVRSAANQRLREWASSRSNVRVIDLAGFMSAAIANRSLTIRGYTWPEGRTRAFLQTDHLHASKQGCAALALAVNDAILSLCPKASAEAVRWDPIAIQEHALQTLEGPGDGQAGH